MQRINVVLTLLFALTLSIGFGQKIDVQQLEGLKIRNIGPAGMSGRVTSIDVDLSNTDRIFVGTASGGVWLSESGGVDWKPVFDEQSLLSIGAVAINQQNPSEIWVGTGEGNPRNSQNSGAGIFKSVDGGKTWTRMGLKNTKTIHRILIHRDDPNIVYVGAQGSAWGNNKERGIYRTMDGGKTWKQVLYVDDTTGCADLVIDPQNPNKLIAAMWEFGRKPWTFNSGGEGSGIYVSHDMGETWERRTDKDGLPKGILGRIGLAIAPSMPNVVYALVEAKANALYKSTDGGKKWQKIADEKKNIGNRPFYYADIFVDPINENRVYSLYSLVSRSEDGGKNFKVILPYSGNAPVHPDHHALWIHPTDPSFLINGNDGGLSISRDRGENWQLVANLPVSQFYHINYDMSIPYQVAGGMQDNGSWVGPSQVWKYGGIRNYDWQEVLFGDGFDVVFNPKDSRYVYAMYQGGNVNYVDTKTGHSQNVKPTHPDSVALRFHWNAAITQNPFEDCGIYFGSQFVHKSMDCGKSWTIISPDLTTNDTLKQKQYESGGLTIDDTRAENHTTILAISPSPLDEGVIWVGTDDGNLQVTRDGGETWMNVAPNLPGMKAGSWIPFIEVSQKNAAEAFIIVNDYRRNDWRAMAYHTTDFGKSFRRIVTEKEVESFALSIVQDPVEENLLWLGTDIGLYFSIDKGRNWNKWTNDFPSVPVRDLKIHPREHDLIVGTFGRAAWILDDIRPIRALAASKGKLINESFKAFDSPDAYLAQYRSAHGIRFTGDAEFIGDNRRGGAMLTLWVKPTKEKEEAKSGEEKKDEKKGKKKNKKVRIQVIDAQNDTLRTYSTKLDTGMNRIYWNLRRDGIRFPSTREPKPDDNTPSGYRVLPGTYKLVFNYGEHKDSTMVTVHADPRLDISLADQKAQTAAFDDFYQTVERATKGFNQLKAAKKTIALVDKSLVHAADSTKKEIGKRGKELNKKITALKALYMIPEDTKGIQRTDDKLNSSLFTAMSYIGASNNGQGQAVERKLAKAKREANAVIEQVNEFFTTDFADYQQAVEAIEFSLFKAHEPIK